MQARLGASGCGCGYEGKLPAWDQGGSANSYASLRVYGWGETEPSQVVIAAMLTRTTASE